MIETPTTHPGQAGSPVRETSPIRAIFRISTPPRAKFLLSTSLGVSAAVSTVALMACSGALIDKAALRPPLYTLMVLMAAVQILALGRGPLRYAERVISHDATLRILGRLRVWLYDEVEPRSPAGLIRLGNGDVLARASGDIESLQDFFVRGITPIVTACVTSIFAVIVVGIILPEGGLLLAICLASGILSTSAVSWVRQRGVGEKEVRIRADLTADMVELLQGAPDLIAYGLDEQYMDRAVEMDRALTSLARRRSWTAGTVSALSTLSSGAAVVGTLALGITAVSSHRLPGYMLAILPLVALATFEVVTPVSDAISKLSHHLAAAKRLVEVANLPIPVIDRSSSTTVPNEIDIAMDQVSLRYTEDGPLALDGLCLQIPAGRRVAIIGSSGAGKSSIVNVLLRFWEISSGNVTIGDTLIDTIPQNACRKLIGWVAQDAHLFNTSIRANIALARPDASDTEVENAARAAQLGRWISTLPDQMETNIGEQGSQLSGGQRQRIALARALLANSPVMVFDEPTSGLDEETAEQLLKDVLIATAGKSLIYITHRLDEIRGFDDVVVISDGHVVHTVVKLEPPVLRSSEESLQPPTGQMLSSTPI